MRSSEFKRDTARLYTVYDRVGDRLIAREPLRIHIPQRWTERGLAKIEDVIYILGIFGLITEDNAFSPSLVTSFVKTEPTRIAKVVVDDEQYIEFIYNKGDAIVSDTKIIMNDNLLHTIFSELTGKGRIPWYVDYDSALNAYAKSSYYNGVTIGAGPVVWEMLVARVMRNPDDKKGWWREREDAGNPPAGVQPVPVGLNNVSFGATNAISKLGGSHFDAGLTDILANPSERVSTMDSILRTS